MVISSQEMMELLKDCGRGTLLFISYKAAREPSERALLESERAVQEGMARRHFVGTLESLWLSRKGEPILTILAYNRDRVVEGRLVEGAYRSFNPAIGELHALSIIEARPKDQVETLFDIARRLPKEELQELAGRLTQLIKAQGDVK